jgi:hypothetical protein
MAKRWDCIVQFALVLWVVRVPLTTTTLGIFILGWTPQAQDLFTEFALTPDQIPFLFRQMLFFWFILIAVWAMPTHYAARLLLDTDARLQELQAAESELKQKKLQNLATQMELKQATCLGGSAEWVPRLLGLATFGAVLVGIFRSYLNRPILDQQEVLSSLGWGLGILAFFVVAGAVGFYFYVVHRPERADLPVLRALKRGNTVLAPVWRVISPGIAAPPGSDDEASRNLGRLILTSVFVIFVLFFLLGADRVGELFPRAMAVPFILGGWLPFLSLLSGVGRQVRAPLIIGLFVLIAALLVVLGDNHSVRRINAKNTVGHDVDISPIPLQLAVTMWMAENKCDAASASCPRPIIIAAAGGASRAAFFMATITGHFMQETTSHGLDPNQVRDRLFAISSVSGGSVGAVVVTAALDAKKDSNDHPCIQSPVPLWWGVTINNWRDCFEALTSGDFLSADFIGFAFNDMFPFGNWRDRAAVLEDAWTRRYNAVVNRADKLDDPPKCKGLDCPFLTLRPHTGHWIPLLVLNGTSEATGGRVVTTPLDSTYIPENSCPTGDDASKCPLFLQADRFHDLLDTDVQSDSWFPWLGGFERYLLAGPKFDDVRLSTAAHNSARFPLISPPGTVRNNKDQAIVDRILDGGYFENYGALGAKELALAVHAVQPNLAPLVIVISNDPEDLIDSSDDSASQDKGTLQKQLSTELEKAHAQVNGGEWVTDVTTPLTTAINGRTAHGILGIEQLHNALHEAMPKCAVLIKVRVWPQYRKSLSMSWWESMPIQRQLHRQTEDSKEKNQNRAHLDAIWDAMKATSSSCVATKQ